MYGVKSSAALDDLEYFNIIKQQPFDISHDVLEGIAVDVLANVSRYLICNHFLCEGNIDANLAEFNKRIVTFKYAD